MDNKNNTKEDLDTGNYISIDDFSKVDLRVAEVIEVGMLRVLINYFR